MCRCVSIVRVPSAHVIHRCLQVILGPHSLAAILDNLWPCLRFRNSGVDQGEVCFPMWDEIATMFPFFIY
jgi:hypothetical protein